MQTEILADLRALIVEYLQTTRMMQLATCIDDHPWCCNVWYGFDGDLNLYWFSSATRRHSIEVTRNPHVAGAIVLPQTPEDTPRGLQFEGIAERLTSDADIERAKEVYVGRIFPAQRVAELRASPTKAHDFYRIIPSMFVLFDAVHYPDNSRREYRMPS